MTLPPVIGNKLTRASALLTDGVMIRAKAFLADVNSTNLVIASGVVAGTLTCLVYITGIMINKHPEPVTFGMWLGFNAGWIGFGVRQFKIKRETHSEFSPQATPSVPPAPPTPEDKAQ